VRTRIANTVRMTGADILLNGQPSADHRTLVVVQPEWNGWRTAVARMVDLEDIHWFQPKGAIRPLIHAYVRCTTLLSGDIPHECSSTGIPHRLHVCILKRHTSTWVFEMLSRLASETHSVRMATSGSTLLARSAGT
jgi:hypothetical protein